jgi:hypothetical protein
MAKPGDQPQKETTMAPPRHPDSEILGRFVLGRLDRRAMATVEDHLRHCSLCGEVAMQVPDDRLVKLVRNSAVGAETESHSCDARTSS